jgi:hypothetical protein
MLRGEISVDAIVINKLRAGLANTSKKCDAWRVASYRKTKRAVGSMVIS